MVRVGLQALAAVAACAAGFVAYQWLADKAGPAGAESRAQAGTLAVNVVHTVTFTPPRNHGLFSPQVEARLTGPQGIGPDQFSATTSFVDRFALDRTGSTAPPPATFAERFGGEGNRSRARAPVRSAAAKAGTTNTGASRRPARAAVAKTVPAKPAPKQPAKSGFQLASASETSVALAYAPTDADTGAGMPGALSDLAPRDPLADLDPARTAIYDITARTVYLPNGRRLEAHSGLGSHRDDPRSAAKRSIGVTPPNVYDLRMREAKFHGVRAIRLIPRDESKMYGRSGILAHTYMLGPSGQSNGCVSFKDYQAFLDAYERGDITRLVVVERLTGDPPSPKTAADWIANTLRSILSQS